MFITHGDEDMILSLNFFCTGEGAAKVQQDVLDNHKLVVDEHGFQLAASGHNVDILIYDVEPIKKLTCTYCTQGLRAVFLENKVQCYDGCSIFVLRVVQTKQTKCMTTNLSCWCRRYFVQEVLIMQHSIVQTFVKIATSML